MSQKKKLVLSPLPEQTDDYSRYEESETRWDRIIAFFVILALFIGLLVYFLVCNDEEVDDMSVLNAPLSEELVQDQVSAAKVLAQDVEQELDSSEKRSPISEQESKVNDTKSSGASSIERPVKSGTSQTIAEDVSTRVEPESKIKEASDSRAFNTPSARIKIEDTGITRASLTLKIKDKEPIGTIPYELVLPDEGIVKVIFFTEMDGLRGKKLYHEWYRNGVRQARVRIPVNVNKQRSHSSKYINTQMLGDWQVKVVDGQQKSYALAEFKVVLP